MMIDVDPKFRMTDTIESGSEAVVGSRIQCKDDIEVFALIRRQGQQFSATEEAILLE